MKIVILGCGPSGGVPNISKGWGKCSSNNPKNRRLRSSVLVHCDDGMNILIDTSPDLRAQLLSVQCKKIDAVLYTHNHADHCHGIDSMRWVSDGKNSIPVYSAAHVLEKLQISFPYIFHNDKNFDQCYACLRPYPVHDLFFIGKNKIIMFEQNHGASGLSYGFCINNKFVYSTDFISLPSESYALLKQSNIDIWILGVIGEESHNSHLNLKNAINLISEIKPKNAFLTHMGSSLDYDSLKKKIPYNVHPCFDGMELILN